MAANTVEDIIHNTRVELKRDLMVTGWDPSPVGEFSVLLDDLLGMGMISCHSLFLELGSGDGSISFVAASKGMGSVGIEIHEELVYLSEQRARVLESQKVIEKNSARFFHSSFYPQEFLDLRKSDSTVSQEVDTEYDEPYECTRPGINLKLRSRDVLRLTPASLDLQLEKFDVWYAFPWKEQVASMMEVFALYAKPGAVYIAHRRDSLDCGAFNILHHYGLYEKTLPLRGKYRLYQKNERSLSAGRRQYFF